MLLSREECHAALTTLGLPFDDADNAIVSLRSGKPVLLHLPKRAARITFQNFAQQLQERPDDLVLMLTSHVAHPGPKADYKKITTFS